MPARRWSGFKVRASERRGSSPPNSPPPNSQNQSGSHENQRARFRHRRESGHVDSIAAGRKCDAECELIATNAMRSKKERSRAERPAVEHAGCVIDERVELAAAEEIDPLVR